jgi:hypothetical protein
MALAASRLVALCFAAHATLLDALDRENESSSIEGALSLWANRARLRTRFEHDLSILDEAEWNELPIVEIDAPLTGQSLPSDQLAVHFTIYAPASVSHIRASGFIGGDSILHTDVYPTAAGNVYSSGLVSMNLVWKMKRIPAARVELTIRVEEVGHPFRQACPAPCGAVCTRSPLGLAQQPARCSDSDGSCRSRLIA